nr:MAG TPA: hypothetical protein [Caudoviricetes sp.]
MAYLWQNDSLYFHLSHLRTRHSSILHRICHKLLLLMYQVSKS